MRYVAPNLAPANAHCDEADAIQLSAAAMASMGLMALSPLVIGRLWEGDEARADRTSNCDLGFRVKKRSSRKDRRKDLNKSDEWLDLSLGRSSEFRLISFFFAGLLRLLQSGSQYPQDPSTTDSVLGE